MTAVAKRNSKQNPGADLVLDAAKRLRQRRARLLVSAGVRTQQSMFFIPEDWARRAVVHHRVLS